MLRSMFAGSVLLAAAACQAAVVGPITFSAESDYTGNFTSGTRFSYDGTAQVLRYAVTSASSGTATVRYTPSADFLTETLSYDTSFSAFNSAPSAGIITRVQADNTGILALVNSTNVATASTSSLQLRLFYNSNASTGAAGTSFADTTVALPRAVATGSILHVNLTQTDAADPVFNLTVSDSAGTLASTGDVAFTANDNYNTAGGIALRGSASFNGVNITFDNVTASVPEPTALAALGLGAAGLLRRRRA